MLIELILGALLAGSLAAAGALKPKAVPVRPPGRR